MAHLARQQFACLFGLLALSDIEENAKHNSVGYVSVVALAPRGDPADIAARQYPEVNFVGADDCTRSGKRGPHPFQIGRMNVPGQDLECDLLFVLRDFPQVIGAFIHGDGVGIDVPGPQCHAGGMGCSPQVLFVPHRHGHFVGRHGPGFLCFLDSCCQPDADLAVATSSIADMTTPVAV